MNAYSKSPRLHRILIGASTGGIDALVTILSEFPENCPPTFIVQHTSSGFGRSLVSLLDRNCRPKVLAAKDSCSVTRGIVCVSAGSEGHMIISARDSNRVEIVQGGSVSGHCPSIDVLFQSGLRSAKSSLGILLTGMGSDGARGLLDLHNAGATTIGQDEASSVVYGMPKVAAELGALDYQLPLRRIASKALSLCDLQR